MRRGLTGAFVGLRPTRKTASVFSIKVAAVVFNAAQSLLLARILGPEGYGIVTLAVSIAIVAAELASFGLGEASIREVPRLNATDHQRDVSTLLQSGLLIIGVSSAALSLAVIAFGQIFLADAFNHYVACLLASGFIPLFAFVLFFSGALQGFYKVALSQFFLELCRPLLVVTGLLIALSFSGAKFGNVVIIVLGAALLATLGAAVALWGRFGFARFDRTSFIIDLGVVSKASPFLAFRVLAAAELALPTAMLAAFASLEAVGLFQPLFQITAIALIAARSAAAAYAPAIARLHATQNQSEIIARTRRFTLFTTLSTALIAAAALILAPLALSLLGPAFAAQSHYLIWMLSAQIIAVAAGPVGHLLMMTQHAKRFLTAQWLALLTGCIVGVAVIPTAGLVGGVAAVVAFVLVRSVLGAIFVVTSLGFDPSILSAWRASRADSQSARMHNAHPAGGRPKIRRNRTR